MFSFNKETGLIRAYGIIGDYEGGISETDFMEALDAMGGRDVVVQLQSDGGSVTAGLSIYNQIENYPGKVIVAIDAMAASIASVIPMAADRITANRNSTIMIHDAWTIALGNAKEFAQLAEVLNMLSDGIADAYADRTGKDREYWRDIMRAEKYYNAQDALAEGLIDEIIGSGAKAQAKPVAVIDPAFEPSVALARVAALRLRQRGF